MKTITLEQLKQFCNEYDDEHGNYPESTWEGAAVLSYIMDRIPPDIFHESNISEGSD